MTGTTRAASFDFHGKSKRRASLEYPINAAKRERFASRASLRSDTSPRERGFALLIVLWSMALLALLMSTLLANGRTAINLAGNVRDEAAARARADGAINEALFHVLAENAQHWAPDGTWHVLPGAVKVRVRSPDGLINPNLASTNLLTGFLRACGAGQAQAKKLADAIIDWRTPPLSDAAEAARKQRYRQAGLHFAPPGAPFADLAELGAVIGMTPALLKKMMPYMSLYQTDEPDPVLAPPLVLRALKLANDPGALPTGFQGSFPTVTIEAEADGPGHARVIRRGVFSLTGADSAAVPFSVLQMTGG